MPGDTGQGQGDEMTKTASLICEWFVLCDKPADGTVYHPIIGSVPTCKRCAEKLELTFE